MQPLHELLHRIKWDLEFGKREFALGYYDRVVHEEKIVPFVSISLDPQRPPFSRSMMRVASSITFRCIACTRSTETVPSSGNAPVTRQSLNRHEGARHIPAIRLRADANRPARLISSVYGKTSRPHSRTC